MALLSPQLDLAATFLDVDQENGTKGYQWRRHAELKVHPKSLEAHTFREYPDQFHSIWAAADQGRQQLKIEIAGGQVNAVNAPAIVCGSQEPAK